MKFIQYYLDCLSHASYLVADESSGVAVVVDPRRDIQIYLDDAHEAGLEIRYVIETHFHADFLSGHLELAEATGAEIIYGAAANPAFPIRRVRTGERLMLGDDSGVVLEFRETPGHTPESISVVVWESVNESEPHSVLTGDTLFIGDVGRPDLLASVGVTADDLARSLYDSLHSQLMVLPDATRVYPAHGAGSACGKNLSTETTSTIGEQRQMNYAVQPMGVEEFVKVVTEGQPTMPGYFGFNANLNKSERSLIDVSAPLPLSLEQVLAAQADGAIAIDTRDSIDFAHGHFVGSINVGLDGRFAEYVGSVIEPGTSLIIIADPGAEVEAKTRLARIGFDQVVGYLQGGMGDLLEHQELIERGSRLGVYEVRQRGLATSTQMIDIRNPGETALGTIANAKTIPLPQLRDRVGEIDLNQPVIVFCAGGYRSSVGASLLRTLGARDVSDLLGGYDAWMDAQRMAVVNR